MWNLKSSNKIISDICTERDLNRHHERLRKVRPMVDTSGNPINPKNRSTTNNPKREQLARARFSEINKENKSLLKKMLDIDMRRSQYRDGRKIRTKSLGSNTLHLGRRRKELEQIDNKNKQLLKKLVEVQSSYSKEKFVNDHRKHKYYSANLSRNSGRQGKFTSHGQPMPMDHFAPHILKYGKQRLQPIGGTLSSRERSNSMNTSPVRRNGRGDAYTGRRNQTAA
mmetsp:Transcript_47418/g.54609  ORF Transcript_47418/g.54609 Transcript_47418/m.54609 type:complete len:225 (+) Transcript_47418:29-703(+)